MGSFGEDLRAERVSRGIALEQITEVTKISQRHLVALEQERFRLLPGGILSKGIVRGYVGAVGLDVQDWTDRFVKAYADSGQMIEDDRGWMAFASNVGQDRIRRREAAELRMRWAGAIVLLLAVARGGVLLGALLRCARRLVEHVASTESCFDKGARDVHSRPWDVQEVVSASLHTTVEKRDPVGDSTGSFCLFDPER